MDVADVMNREVLTVEAGTHLRDAVVTMLRDRVGSVVVTGDGDPVGIVTESDALKAAVSVGEALGEVPVERAMSRPLVTVAPGTSIREAARKMTEEDVKKLPVMDGLELVGILTMTDIVHHEDDLLREAHELERARDGWNRPDLHTGYPPGREGGGG